jgi:hypothetical protein
MNKRFILSKIAAIGIVTSTVLAGCLSFGPGTTMDPYYAIGSSSLEKLKVTHSGGINSGEVIIGKVPIIIIGNITKYKTINRPAVPAEPSAPSEPSIALKYLAKPRVPSTRDLGGNALTVQEYNEATLKYQAELDAYNAAQAQYEKDIADYPRALAKYQQDIAAYKANLPKYQEQVEGQIKSIMDNINPDAPLTWYAYVEGQYLLYNINAPQ